VTDKPENRSADRMKKKAGSDTREQRGELKNFRKGPNKKRRIGLVHKPTSKWEIVHQTNRGKTESNYAKMRSQGSEGGIGKLNETRKGQTAIRLIVQGIPEVKQENRRDDKKQQAFIRPNSKKRRYRMLQAGEGGQGIKGRGKGTTYL